MKQTRKQIIKDIIINSETPINDIDDLIDDSETIFRRIQVCLIILLMLIYGFIVHQFVLGYKANKEAEMILKIEKIKVEYQRVIDSTYKANDFDPELR